MLEIHHKNNPRKTVYVDIDETICFFNGPRVYEEAVPSHPNIAKVNQLYDSGWIVTYWTARGSSQPNNTERLESLRQLTLSQLNSWGAKFHHLEIGDKKPLYDLVIDDKAIKIEDLNAADLPQG